MSARDDFLHFIHRIRAGDQAAAAELVARYESLIRCQVRLWLTDPRLCRLFDSLDISQSVLASFFLRAAAGQYDLDRPEQLARLLARMARNKVISKARQLQARAPDCQRIDEVDLEAVRAAVPGPGELVAGRELLEEVSRRLSPEERQIVALRTNGRAWPVIAAELGGTPEGRRKQLARALDRVAQELGLNDEDDDGTP